MKLPNVEKAVIADAKIINYLLSSTHTEGKDKAMVFLSHGFRAEEPETLKASLLKVVQGNEALRTIVTIHGQKYVIEGDLETPDGRGIYIRTIWIVDRGGTIPRFVSAYPA